MHYRVVNTSFDSFASLVLVLCSKSAVSSFPKTTELSPVYPMPISSPSSASSTLPVVDFAVVKTLREIWLVESVHVSVATVQNIHLHAREIDGDIFHCVVRQARYFSTFLLGPDALLVVGVDVE